MIWTEENLTLAMAAARKAALVVGRPVSVVADDRPKGWFQARPRGWRVEASPAATDTILIADVPPKRWSAEMSNAWAAATRDAPDAADALRRMLDRCSRRGDGTARDDDERLAMLSGLADLLTAADRARERPLPDTAFFTGL